MYFVGIDIARGHHEACINDSTGQSQGKTLRFPNTQAGGQILDSWSLYSIDQ
ncbi:hypothetical protein AAC03nite_18530 [Alicyclobacillus acidoterrestris]|nr:hypothetical protein AAC03nite_18530 [Alicyclobacillus acidoterrestris]